MERLAALFLQLRDSKEGKRILGVGEGELQRFVRHSRGSPGKGVLWGVGVRLDTGIKTLQK